MAEITFKVTGITSSGVKITVSKVKTFDMQHNSENKPVEVNGFIKGGII